MEALATPGGFGILHPAGKLDPCWIALRSPHDAPMHSTNPEMGHGLQCRLTMFTKQVSRPMDIPDPPSWPRRRSRSSNSRKDLVTGPIRGFCALQVPSYTPALKEPSLR